MRSGKVAALVIDDFKLLLMMICSKT